MLKFGEIFATEKKEKKKKNIGAAQEGALHC
jgi:hypothetical protein